MNIYYYHYYYYIIIINDNNNNNKKLHFTKSHFLKIFWQYLDLGLRSDSFIYSEFHYSFTIIVTMEAQEKSTGNINIC